MAANFVVEDRNPTGYSQVIEDLPISKSQFFAFKLHRILCQTNFWKIMRNIRKLRALAVGAWACAVLLHAGPVMGSVLITSPGTGILTSFSVEPITSGYSFTVQSSPLVVSALGIWDENTDGLFNSHQLGLWSSTGTLLASTTIASGASAPLVGEFRYATLTTPLLLSPGSSYVLGANYNMNDADRYHFNGNNVFDLLGVSSDFTVSSSRFTRPAFGAPPSGFAFPAQTDAPVGSSVGPNLQYTVVPEPAMVSLVLVGAFGLLAGRRHPRS